MKPKDLSVVMTVLEPVILTRAEVAERLKVSPAFIYECTRERCENPMPFHRLGKYLRFDWNEVKAWWAANANRPRFGNRTARAKFINSLKNARHGKGMAA